MQYIHGGHMRRMDDSKMVWDKNISLPIKYPWTANTNTEHGDQTPSWKHRPPWQEMTTSPVGIFEEDRRSLRCSVVMRLYEWWSKMSLAWIKLNKILLAHIFKNILHILRVKTTFYLNFKIRSYMINVIFITI